MKPTQIRPEQDVYGTTSSSSPTGPASGDLRDGYPGPRVTGLQGNPICEDAPATNDVLTWTGTEWCPVPAGGTTGQFLTTTLGGQAHLLTVASSGTTTDLDCSLANTFDITLTDDCTLTISNPAPAGVDSHIVVILRQGGVGSYTVTWPGSVAWQDTTTGLSGGPAPTLYTAIGAQNVIELSTLDGGVTWGGVYTASVSSFATPAIVLGSSAAAGSASTIIRSDATIAAFDATVPASVGNANATGSAAFAARRDHVHAIDDTTLVGASQSAASLAAAVHAHVYLEQMTGDGSTTVFYLAQEAVPDQPPEVFVNGVLTDVTLGGMDDTITFGSAPAAAAAIRVNYLAAIA